MPNRRFLMIAGTLLLSVMGATVWLVPAVHGQTPPGPIRATALYAALDAATAVQEAVPAMQGALDLLGGYFGVKAGVLVTSVAADSAASRAGLRAGDVITAVDGAPVSDPARLRRRLWRDQDARETTLDIVRDKKAMSVTVTFDEPKGSPAPVPVKRRA